MTKRWLLAALFISVPLAGCWPHRPPQTGFYCIDVPGDKVGTVPAFIQDIAARLRFEVSEGTFAFEPNDVHRAYEIYGRGVSLFIDASMVSGKPDKFENRPTKTNPSRWSMQAVKTGWWQRESFDRALSAAVNSAKSHGFAVSKAPDGKACSTDE